MNEARRSMKKRILVRLTTMKQLLRGLSDTLAYAYEPRVAFRLPPLPPPVRVEAEARVTLPAQPAPRAFGPITIDPCLAPAQSSG